MHSQIAETKARGYKTICMLNSAEHDILNAPKYKNIKIISLFLGSDKRRMLFIPIKNVKMPTIVGILTFMSRIVGILTFMSRNNVLLSSLSMKKLL